ncbi:MAG: NAD(P)/FAD-dependent oxidoreductase [Ignavibacteria bacterium]|nr:NAD(P)/FAD-dependent oxidoreductase [Ignavibacteria bacterium]
MKKVIIIGGGIAGLSAGCYCQMNGFESEIYEMHDMPGGLCTGWRRKNFTFDGCLHWLVGTSPSNPMYRMWEELGVVKGKKFFDYDYFIKVIDKEGNVFFTYTNPDRFKEQMLEYSKEDRKFICSVIKDIKWFMKMKIPIDYGFFTLFKMIPMFYRFWKYSMPVSEFAGKFKNKKLGELVNLAFDWHDMSAVFLIWTLAYMGSRDAQYVMGGSIELAKSIEQRYLSLGGKIHYKSEVIKILVKNNKASGIKLNDGTEIQGDIIISAADGYSTIYEWLGGLYTDKKLDKKYKTLEPFPPLLYISIGVEGNYRKEPYSVTFPLDKPVLIANKEVEYISLANKSFDPSLSANNTTAFHLSIPTDYDYWAELYKDKTTYLQEKERIANEIIEGITKLYPDFKSQVREVDVATPVTFKRYTGNYRGSYEGWLLTKKSMTVQMPKTLRGLSDFYMAGHWTAPGGGLPTAASTARQAVKLLCRHNKIKFSTTTV